MEFLPYNANKYAYKKSPSPGIFIFFAILMVNDYQTYNNTLEAYIEFIITIKIKKIMYIITILCVK